MITLEILSIKEELRHLIDAYASFTDEKSISKVMDLFTPDGQYNIYMGGALVASTSGTDQLEKEFTEHASQVKTYFTINGQHKVEIDGQTASGVSFTQMKMIREPQGKKVLTDYSVRYDDKYVFLKGKWLIKERNTYFIMIEERQLTN